MCASIYFAEKNSNFDSKGRLGNRCVKLNTVPVRAGSVGNVRTHVYASGYATFLAKYSEQCVNSDLFAR